VPVIGFSVQCYLFASNERDTENVWTDLMICIAEATLCNNKKIGKFSKF